MLFGPAVHIVFDRYLVNSMKSQTRAKRRDDVSRLTSVHIQEKNVPGWNSSLVNGSLKAGLTKLHTLYLAEHCNKCINRNQYVYVSGGIYERH